jgi:hypothetical protein
MALLHPLALPDSPVPSRETQAWPAVRRPAADSVGGRITASELAFRGMGMSSMVREHVDGNASPSRRCLQEQAAARGAVGVGSGGGCSGGLGGGGLQNERQEGLGGREAMAQRDSSSTLSCEWTGMEQRSRRRAAALET